MMKKFLLTTFVALLCGVAQSDTIGVYRINATATITGGGNLITKRYSGHLVFDEIENYFLIVEPARKRFYVEFPGIDFVSATGKMGKIYESWHILDGEFRSMDIKGVNVSNSLYATTWVSLPNSYSLSGTDRVLGVENYVWEYKGTMLFDRVTSSEAIKQNLNIDQVISRLKNKLILLGYQEEFYTSASGDSVTQSSRNRRNTPTSFP